MMWYKEILLFMYPKYEKKPLKNSGALRVLTKTDYLSFRNLVSLVFFWTAIAENRARANDIP